MANQNKPKLTLNTNIDTMGEEVSAPVKSISPPWKQHERDERDEREVLAKVKENEPVKSEAEQKAKTVSPSLWIAVAEKF
jgi:hypothetical protein